MIEGHSCRRPEHRSRPPPQGLRRCPAISVWSSAPRFPAITTSTPPRRPPSLHCPVTGNSGVQISPLGRDVEHLANHQLPRRSAGIHAPPRERRLRSAPNGRCGYGHRASRRRARWLHIWWESFTCGQLPGGSLGRARRAVRAIASTVTRNPAGKREKWLATARCSLISSLVHIRAPGSIRVHQGPPMGAEYIERPGWPPVDGDP
jgi:hypothetical protein